MTNQPETIFYQSIKDAKAALRDPHASAAKKLSAGNHLISSGWSSKRVIAYETTPRVKSYTVRLTRDHTQARRLITVPALSALDARLTALVMYPDWIVLTASHDIAKN